LIAFQVLAIGTASARHRQRAGAVLFPLPTAIGPTGQSPGSICLPA